MKRVSLFFLGLQGMSAAFGYAQGVTPPEIEWQRSFGGSDRETLTVIDQTRDGGYIIGGTTSSGISGNKTNAALGPVGLFDPGAGDWWVIRLDANGNELWQRAFGGTGADYLYGLVQTPDGGFVLAGDSASDTNGNKTSPSYGSSDAWVVKIDSNGIVLWQRSFGGTGSDSSKCIQLTSDGGFVLAGDSFSAPDENKTSPLYGWGDYWIVRLDPDGNKLWENSFGGSDIDSCRSVRQTADGGFILGGETYSGADGSKTSTNFSPPGYIGQLGGSIDYWVVRVDTNGVKLWEGEYGSQDTDRLWALDSATGGGSILAGYAYATAGGNKTDPGIFGYDYWIVRLGPDGPPLWDRTYGGTSDDRLATARLTRDGGFVLAGMSTSPAGDTKSAGQFGGIDLWVVRGDASGNRLWDQSYGGTGNEGASGPPTGLVCETSDGGLLVGGNSSSGADGNKTTPNYGGYDFWILKLRSCLLLGLQTNLPGRGSILLTPPPGPQGCYTSSTVVTLTANPEPGFSFAAWSGSRASTNNPLTVPLFTNETIIANFAAPGTPLLSLAPSMLTSSAPECCERTLSQSLSVWNTGGGVLNYLLTTSAPWISVTPGTGISVGQTNTHSVTCLSSALAPGQHTGVVTVQSVDMPGLSTTVDILLQIDAQSPAAVRVAPRDSDHPSKLFRYFFRGASNCVYVSEFSTDFDTWAGLQTNRAGAAEIEVIDRDATNSLQRFYRSRLLR